MGIKIGGTDITKIKIASGQTPRLPVEYQEVEWIRGSSFGGQYIDTGMANISTATKVEFSYTPYTSNQGIIFMDNDWDSEGFGNGWDYYYYKNYPGSNMPSNSVGTKVTIVLANDGCSKDGSNVRVPNKSSLSTSGTILLMANRRGGSITGTNGRDCALYYYKRWESGTLVQEFIPCYRKADSVIGMYDIVNDTFYTNAGTGNFTKGNDVVVETYKDITKVYLGSTQVRPTQSGGWQPSANTLLYLPLESDVVDQSGQATTRTFTTSGLSYTTVGGVPSVHMGTTGGIKLTAPYPLIPYTVTDPVTFSVLIYVTSAQTSGRRLIADTGATGGNRIWSCIYEGTTNIRFAIDYDAVNYVNLTATNYSVANTWIHIVGTVSTTSSHLYINGNLVDSGGGCPAPAGWWNLAYDNTQGLFCTRDVDRYTSGLNGNARELIIENKEWTAQDVADYYTRIKSKLGI